MKSKRMKKIITSLMIVIALLTVQFAQVKANAEESDPATVQVNTWEELLAAVSSSSEGDVIEVMDAITVPKGMSLNAPGRILKRGTAQGCLVTDWNFEDDTINSFDGIIFDGAGLDATDSFLTINANSHVMQCEFRNCKSISGTVCINAGEVLFTDCTFKDNQGNTGSHIMNQSDGKVTIKDCIFTGGQSGNIGGAIYCGLDNNNVEITGCTITGNAAASNGGAIYNRGALTITGSKVFGNSATNGADIYSATPVTTETMLTDLESIYADENIIVKGWLTESNDLGEVFMKLDYEDKPEEPDQGDSDDTGNTDDPGEGGEGGEGSGTEGDDPGTGDAGTSDGSDQGNDNPGTPSDPGDSGSGTDSGDNGGTDAGNGGQTPSTPSDSGDTGSSDNQPGDSSGTGGNNDAGGTQTPSEQPGTGSGATGDNNSNNSTNDNSSHDSTNANSSTDNSNNSQTTSSTDNSRTESSDNHSSTTTTTTNNYYQSSQTPVQQNQEQTPVQSQQPIVVNNYIQPSQDGQEAVQGQQVDNSSPSSESPSNDPSNNIRIDAKGVDMSFEVVNGVYSITINAERPSEPALTSAPVQAVTDEPAKESGVNWYEIIKIVLLAALFINLTWKDGWKRKRKTSPDTTE